MRSQTINELSTRFDLIAGSYKWDGQELYRHGFPVSDDELATKNELALLSYLLENWRGWPL